MSEVINFFDEYNMQEREKIMKNTKVYNDIFAALKKYQIKPMLSIYTDKFLILDKKKKTPEETKLNEKETPGDLVFSPKIFGTVFLTDFLKICEACKSTKERVINKFLSYVQPKGYLVLKFEAKYLPEIMSLFKDTKNISAITCEADVFFAIKKVINTEKN